MNKNTNSGLRNIIQEIMKSVLDESGPDAMRVDWSIMRQQLDEAISDESSIVAEDVTIQMRDKILSSVAKIINQHNMVDTEFGRINPHSFEQLLRDFDDDDSVSRLTAECFADIDEAIKKFADSLGQFAVHVVSANER